MTDKPKQHRVFQSETNRKRSKGLSVRKMFYERMKREARSKEFHEILTRKKLEKGHHSYNLCVNETMREMGYLGPEEERELYAQWLSGHPDGKWIAFEAAISRLPATADQKVENDWVMAHPKLTRKLRGAETVEITAEDLFDSAHGRCPSAAAANMLVIWANDSKKLNEKRATVMAKPEASSGKDTEVVVDENLADVERLLKEMGGV